MARKSPSRLSILGVLSILVGVAAFAAPFIPQLDVGPNHGGLYFALGGAALGLLAVWISISGKKSNSGVPVLGILVSLGAIAFFNRSLISGWFGKETPKSPTPAAVTPDPSLPPSPGQTTPRKENKSNNIFGIGDGSSDTALPPSGSPTPPSPAAIRPNTPGVTPAAPSVPHAPGLTPAAARAQLDLALKSVERSLAGDPGYRGAKADADAAEARYQAAQKEYDAGSQPLIDASRQRGEANKRLRQVIEAAAANDPTVQAAKRAVSESQH